MAGFDSTGKSPAFQFYPKDFLTDEHVRLMSLQERGAYITLICQCWTEGSLPADVGALARLCGSPAAAFRRLWPALVPCFRAVSGRADRLTHPRLDLERRKQREYRRRQADAGKQGAESRWRKDGGAKPSPSNKDGCAIDSPMAKNGSSSSSAISTLQSASSDSCQKTEPANARSKRPIFSGTRFVVFEWQLDDLRRLLGAHFEAFDVHAWFFDLNERAEREGFTVPQRDGGKWLQDQTLTEAIRRGIPVAAAQPVGKTAGNLAAAARFVARGARA